VVTIRQIEKSIDVLEERKALLEKDQPQARNEISALADAILSLHGWLDELGA